MRILYFSDNLSGHNRRFLEKLSQTAHDVWFLSCGQEQLLPEGWLPPGIRHLRAKRTFPAGSDPHCYEACVEEFAGLIRQVRPDLVHAGPVQSAGYVAALSGFHPLLVMSWGSDILFHPQRNDEWRDATKKTLEAAEGFFSDCDAVRIAAERFASLERKQLVQFPWGIQRGAFTPGDRTATRQRLSLESDAIYFISTRSWEPIYGIDILLSAFEQAHAKDSRLRLLLLGAGSQAKELQRFIDAQHLQNVVLATGMISQNELPAWFRASDGYISCNRSDGTSISLLEAMATGLPVVVSDIAANREWVKEQNGWLAAVDSSEAFAEKLLTVANQSAAERSAISEANQRVVADRADWDKNFPQLLDLYERLVGKAAKYA